MGSERSHLSRAWAIFPSSRVLHSQVSSRAGLGTISRLAETDCCRWEHSGREAVAIVRAHSDARAPYRCENFVRCSTIETSLRLWLARVPKEAMSSIGP